MAMLGALFGAMGIVSKDSIEEGIKARFLKKYVASGGTASLDSAIERKFKKKLELIEKNLATASAAYDLAREWAIKNDIEPFLPPPPQAEKVA